MRAIIALVQLKKIPEKDLPFYWKRKKEIAKIYDLVKETENLADSKLNDCKEKIHLKCNLKKGYLDTKSLCEDFINKDLKN